MQSNWELAKSGHGDLPQIKPIKSAPAKDTDYSELSRTLSEPIDSLYAFDQPVDISMLNLNGDTPKETDTDDGDRYVFIPPDPRAYYRAIVKETLSHDIREENAVAPNSTTPKLLSKRSSQLLSEVGFRWRLPYTSRMILFLDVAREMFMDQQIDLDTLGAIFNYVKEPSVEKNKAEQTMLSDRTKWTMADYVLNQQILALIHDTLLRDLFEQLQNCYESTPPSIGAIMTVLEIHIYDNPLFSRTPEDLDRFSEQVKSALSQRASEIYNQLFNKEIRQNNGNVEFYHVVQLGKAVLKCADKIQKRYRKTPQIMGVDPFVVLVETILPAFESDARDQISDILHQAEQRGEEVPVQDGFDLYKELVNVRRVHSEALPGVRFNFNIEGLLATFVWRWIDLTKDKLTGWVEEAVKQDAFEVCSQIGQAASADNRHSVSALDIFRSFNQAVEQVVKLEWDDDLQYAKFMTALSKAIGTGIVRYCELLEQLFVKEMDRLSPEQEAVLKLTRQQKWMQMAKDTIANTHKIEPFQFLAEVCHGEFIPHNFTDKIIAVLRQAQ